MANIDKPRPLLELLEKLDEFEAIKKEAGSTLKSHRHTAGLSQKAFADRLGVSQAYLSQVENGHKTPTTPLLREATEILLDPERGPNGNKDTQGKGDRKGWAQKGSTKRDRKRS